MFYRWCSTISATQLHCHGKYTCVHVWMQRKCIECCSYVSNLRYSLLGMPTYYITTNVRWEKDCCEDIDEPTVMTSTARALLDRELSTKKQNKLLDKDVFCSVQSHYFPVNFKFMLFFLTWKELRWNIFKPTSVGTTEHYQTCVVWVGIGFDSSSRST